MIRFLAFRILVVAPSALLTDHRPHGDGLLAFGFVTALAARGHELHVAAREVDLRGAPPPNVHVHRLCRGRAPGLAGRVAFMRSIRELAGELRGKDGVELVHQLNPVEVGVSLAVAGSGLPVVLGPYVPDWPPSEGTPVAGVVSQGIKRVLRALEQRAASAVLLSTPAAAVKLHAAPERLLVREVPPGIDARAWAPAGAPAGQDVLFVASLQPRKGVLGALEAFERLAGELPAARLLVAGVGPQEAELRRRAAASPAGGRVRLLGSLPREEVVRAMQDCAVLCVPSFGEPLGLSALEAMACARPVVTTEAGGLRHLVPDDGGRRVPPGDTRALAAALAEILSSPALQRAMGERNRRVVEERYAWPRVAARIEAAYADALDVRRRMS